MSAEQLDGHLLTGAFASVSLEQLNSKAAMLERLDNKYVVQAAMVNQALDQLVQHFDVLEIEGRRAFTYETCYFDDEQLHSYLDHHQGRRKRCKVRVRRYTDAGLCFVEVKLKDKRGITVKKRLRTSPQLYGRLDEAAHHHVQQSYRALYGEGFPHQLQAVMDMRYRRITLVARQGGERMTIDGGLEFRHGDHCRAVDGDVFVIETKSANGNGVADRVLRALHQHPTPGCSKYCVGMAALGLAPRCNKFLPALRKLDVLPCSDRYPGGNKCGGQAL